MRDIAEKCIASAIVGPVIVVVGVAGVITQSAILARDFAVLAVAAVTSGPKIRDERRRRRG